MAYNGLVRFIEQLEKHGELIRIREFVNPELEISEITDRISKLPGGGKALLFENNGTPFPLLINALGSENRIALAFGRHHVSEVEEEMTRLFRELVIPRASWWEKLRMLPMLKEVASWMPKKIAGRGLGQEVFMGRPDLEMLPVLKCWPADGGRFITLPAVHTLDPENGIPNVGMYRMQIFGKALTGMHWHPHKTGAAHFEKYKASGKLMPVTVTLGGDPVYIYAATAPMPENMDEYLLAGFLRKKQVRMVKCLTNDLYVPEDVDFVIEGFVDPSEEPVREGPFGDHTGFYSLAGDFPKFHVTCITHRKDAVYPATIVGIPPMEDAWIGKATERIFLSPIRLTMISELMDMDLPFAGVAHNIAIVKIRKTYPGQAVKVMHSLWGAGQMMFNKIMVVVDESSADIHDYSVIARIFRDNFDTRHSLHFSRGPLDILDHSSQNCGFGSKLGIDLTRPFPEEVQHRQKGNPWAEWKLPATGLRGMLSPEFNSPDLKKHLPFLKETANLCESLTLPVLLLTVDKNERYSKRALEEALSKITGLDSFWAVVLFDHGACLDDLFALVWLLGGNLEPYRDISFIDIPGNGNGRVMLVDATIKTGHHDRFQRDWPNIVTMDNATVAAVDLKWPLLGLGDFLPCPSMKYKPLVKGQGAVRELV